MIPVSEETAETMAPGKRSFDMSKYISFTCNIRHDFNGDRKLSCLLQCVPTAVPDLNDFLIKI